MATAVGKGRRLSNITLQTRDSLSRGKGRVAKATRDLDTSSIYLTLEFPDSRCEVATLSGSSRVWPFETRFLTGRGVGEREPSPSS